MNRYINAFSTYHYILSTNNKCENEIKSSIWSLLNRRKAKPFSEMIDEFDRSIVIILTNSDYNISTFNYLFIVYA